MALNSVAVLQSLIDTAGLPHCTTALCLVAISVTNGDATRPESAPS
jgi:hypothetical protein